MKQTKNSKYLFQRRKANFAKKLFEGGLTATSYILFAVKDFNDGFTRNFLAGLPDSYPGFKILKDMFGCNSKKGFKENTIRVDISRLKK